MRKVFNVCMLLLKSNKKSIINQVFWWHLKTVGVVMAVSLFIIGLSNYYNMGREDTLILSVIMFICTFVIVAIIDKNSLKKYLRPLQEFLNVANGINNGKDLSKRIKMGRAGLEIQMFSKTFNRMFDRLQQSFEREKQFSINISHEIKTPLSVIVSNCEYAQDCLDIDDKEELQETLDTINVQAQRISNIISQLSLLSKLENDRKLLEFEEFSINELVEITADEVSMEYEDKDITIKVHYDEDIVVIADRIMITRMFINLLSNSMKYGVDGGHTDVYLYKRDEYLIGRVSDDGIGISKENINNIWEPFFRVDHSKENSTGLGLPMVKKIVNLHGGSIYAKSVLGEGTNFHFKVPIVKM